MYNVLNGIKQIAKYGVLEGLTENKTKTLSQDK